MNYKNKYAEKNKFFFKMPEIGFELGIQTTAISVPTN